MTRRPLLSLSLAALPLLMAGCQQGGKAAPGASINALSGEWTLDSIEGSDIAGDLPENARRPSLLISPDGAVGGFGGVNRINSRLDLDGLSAGRFDLGPVVATKMAGPPALMQLESRFTRLLDQTGTFTLDGDALVLLPDGKGPPMKLLRVR